jgi:hypothetical protein
MKVFVCTVLLLSSLMAREAACAPVSAQTALRAVAAWLDRQGAALLPANRNAVAALATATADASGKTLYYIVPLASGGFVLAAGDDTIEPILAFAGSGAYSDAPGSPLAYWAQADVADRLSGLQAAAGAARATSEAASASAAKAKWNALLGREQAKAQGGVRSKASIASVMVAPLIESKWGQDNVGEDTPTYNLYTPTLTGGTRTLTGCVATAMAQLMRYHKHPTGPVGKTSHPIKVCQTCSGTTPGECAATTLATRGGDGNGGAYDFEAMPLVPTVDTPLAQRQMLSSLMADAGATAHMDYASCFSGAWQWYAASGLTSVFSYSNAVWNSGGPTSESSMTADQYRLILNANLDAALPVLVTMSTVPNGSGHEVVADGYGYDGFTTYHHLNMGWNGQDDVWYNLPIVSAGTPAFNLIWTLVFNVYTSGTGEIISGRVTDNTSQPLSGVTVTVRPAAGGEGFEVKTNDKGIYAFSALASNTAFTLQAQKPGWVFAPLYVTTGTSGSPTGDDEGRITNFQNNACGNVWGADFAGTWAGLAVTPQVMPLLLNN